MTGIRERARTSARAASSRAHIAAWALYAANNSGVIPGAAPFVNVRVSALSTAAPPSSSTSAVA
eukprot:1924814-Prymnesium_polylepis.1